MFTIRKNVQNFENKTVRLSTDIIDKLNDLASENNISFNNVVSQCIEYALNNMIEEETENLESFQD